MIEYQVEERIILGDFETKEEAQKFIDEQLILEPENNFKIITVDNQI